MGWGGEGSLCHSDGSISQQNRQMKHISAEQKRRFNIKMGFDTLNSLISNNTKLVSGRRAGRADRTGGHGGLAAPAAALTRPPLADQPRHHAAEDRGVHHQVAAGAQPDAGGGPAAARGNRGAQHHHHVRLGLGAQVASRPHWHGTGGALIAGGGLCSALQPLPSSFSPGSPPGPAHLAPSHAELPWTLPVVSAPASSCSLPRASPSPGASLITCETCLTNM